MTAQDKIDLAKSLGLENQVQLATEQKNEILLRSEIKKMTDGIPYQKINQKQAEKM